MARIALLALVVSLALVGCKKPAAQTNSDVSVTDRSLTELPPETGPATPPSATSSPPPTKVASLSSTPDRPARTVTPPTPPVAAASGGKTYTVQKGETLWSIAKKLYGDPKRSKDIAAANSIADPGKVRVGQVLTIP